MMATTLRLLSETHYELWRQVEGTHTHTLQQCRYKSILSLTHAYIVSNLVKHTMRGTAVNMSCQKCTSTFRHTAWDVVFPGQTH